MSKGKEKVLEVDDDELNFLPSLLTDPAFDPGIPLEPIRSSVGTSARKMSPQTTSSSGNSDEEGFSGSKNTLSEGRGDDSGEVSPSGASPPEGRSTVGGSWGVHFPLQPDQLKRVEAVLANSCPSRELITVYNLLESRLVLPGHKMEDAVIGALNRKRSRPQTTKRDHNKDAPSAKRANITLPPAPAKVGETSGAATDPASSSPPVGSRSRLHLVPYLNELSKLVSKKDLEDFDGCTLGELVGAMQYSAFHLNYMTTYYKAKVGRYDRKMKEDIQSATTRADVAEKKELTKVKEDLQRQKAMYEARLESLRGSHRAQVENLEREADNQYNQGLRHSYRCIMAVLEKQHPDLKIDDLAAGVAQHMDEEAAKEDAEGVEPIVIDEENSHPRAVPTNVGETSTPADVGEASTPPDAIGDTPCT
ncbi:hypothetical protein CUMW_186150 [Citrus unshiu]|nr:hypothetical protein CUMW_186150 [Citrus unshiu]